MISLSLKTSAKTSAGSQSYLWSFPDSPIQIRITFDLIGRLQKEVLALAPSDREVGGLLMGSVSSSGGEIEVSNYLPLSPDSEANRNFMVCPDSLQDMNQRLGSDERLIGFYRTHLDQRINFREQDIECARSKFNDPANVFLVIRPHDGCASAAFFFWYGDSVVGGLAFPFSIKELTSRSWETLVGGSSKRRLSGLLACFENLAPRLSTRARIGSFALAAAFLALAGVLQIHHPLADSSHDFRLRVQRALLGVVVAWNSAIPEIVNAKGANLLIWDDSKKPAVVPLTSAQLHSGRAFVPAVGDKIEVRLEIGNTRSPPVVSLSDVSGLGPSAPPSRARNLAVPIPESSIDQSEKKVEYNSAPTPMVETSLTGRRTALLPKNPDQHSIGVARETTEGQRTSFAAAVPIHQVRPDVQSRLKPLIQTDNVVEVKVHIDASGNVTVADIASMKGPVTDSLSQSALNAALGWKFRPATSDGNPVSSDMILEFVFTSSGP